jgi:hypothetical protein
LRGFRFRRDLLRSSTEPPVVNGEDRLDIGTAPRSARHSAAPIAVESALAPAMLLGQSTPFTIPEGRLRPQAPALRKTRWLLGPRWIGQGGARRSCAFGPRSRSGEMRRVRARSARPHRLLPAAPGIQLVRGPSCCSVCSRQIRRSLRLSDRRSADSQSLRLMAGRSSGTPKAASRCPSTPSTRRSAVALRLRDSHSVSCEPSIAPRRHQGNFHLGTIFPHIAYIDPLICQCLVPARPARPHRDGCMLEPGTASVTVPVGYPMLAERP